MKAPASPDLSSATLSTVVFPHTSITVQHYEVWVFLSVGAAVWGAIRMFLICSALYFSRNNCCMSLLGFCVFYFNSTPSQKRKSKQVYDQLYIWNWVMVLLDRCNTENQCLETVWWCLSVLWKHLLSNTTCTMFHSQKVSSICLAKTS